MDILITTLLLLLATVLLVIELVFIPGFGFTGILGVLSMLASVLYAFFVIGNTAGWIVIVLSGLICVALFLWALYGNSLDKVSLKKKVDSKVDMPDISSLAVGDRGIARTRLALVGEADFGGNIVEVKSETGYISEGEEIEIARISGGSLFVRKLK